MRRLDKGMLTSGIGDRCRGRLSRSFGDLSTVNLTPQVQALFQSNAGIMLDFTLSSSLYQDSARTTPVTASGQPIGSVTDLSPNGKNASSTGGSRPLWNSLGYGTFDAFDDYLQTAAVDFSATGAVTVVASVRKLSDAAIGMLCELSANAGTNAGTFYMTAPSSAGLASYAARSGGTISNVVVSPLTYAAPITSVLAIQADIAGDSLRFRVNGSEVATSSADQGTGNYGNFPLNIGARNAASLFFNGRIYRLLVIGRTLISTERNTAERWAAQPVGIVIP